MSWQPRILEKFENSAGSISFAFPLNEYEYEAEQGLYLPSAPLTGAHYEYDQLGLGQAVKQPGREMLRFMFLETSPATVDTKVDEMLSELQRIGQGKLYSIDNADVRRWAYARPMAKPSLRWSAGDILRKTASVAFRRDSDWYGTTQVNQNETMSLTSHTFTVNNTGNAKVYNAIFTLIGTFTNPKINNTTTGYILQSTRDGSAAGHRLRFSGETRRVEFSTDGGTTYQGDYTNFVRQTGQVHLMVLDPGSNSITVTFDAVPSGTLNITFYPAFE